MANTAGRDFVIKKNGTAVAGVTDVSMSAAAAAIVVTDQGDDGNVRVLTGVMNDHQLTFTASGFEKDQVIQNICMGGDPSAWFLDDITIEWGNGATLAGDFYITSYSEGGAQGDGHKFDFSIATNGTWVFTPAGS